MENDLAEAIEKAKRLEVDPDKSGKVNRIRERIATYSVDVDDLENRVYSALFNFFRRYYDKGDFISQRRYKEGVYAIPYEGEEVKLYWANHDQYYIKTSEYLRDYTFKLPSGSKAHFKLVEADIEKDNRKETDDKKRRFLLVEEPLVFENGELSILFEFRPDEEKQTQKKLNKQAVETIIGLREGIDEQDVKDALAELTTLSPTESDKSRTLLAKHLEDYTRRNTQDYFIHKNLGKFLRRELDFFIKNEIMHLDNIENEDAPRVEQYLSKIKVIRQIAHKLIDFLAQIEDFQKKLWLKKKFVVETNYCITLDRIPEKLYAEIAANDAQREEWVRLFAIDKIKTDGNMFAVAYTNPLSVEFLKTNPFLLVDTKFFDENLKYKMLASTEAIDNELDGLLVHSENFQAINLLAAKYREGIKCVYIDPPYNTGEDGFPYKDGYQYSSWLSMIGDRLSLLKLLLSPDNVFLCSIDDYEFNRLNLLVRQIWGDESWIASFIRKRRSSSAMSKNLISQDHEYIACYTSPQFIKAKGIPKIYSSYSNPDNDSEGDWTLGDLSVGMDRTQRPNQYYDLTCPHTGKKYPANPNRVWAYIPESMRERIEAGRVLFPDDPMLLEHNINISSPMTKRYKKDLKSDVNPVSTLIGTGKKKSITEEKVILNAGLNTESAKEIISLFGLNEFPYAKPTSLVNILLEQFCPNKEDIAFDFFAGSGTTGHAIINLNRIDDGKRQFILVEMGDYFETVLKPRIQKVIYSEDWKDGKPVSRKGSSHAFKYIKLESYEDTLNNLELNRTEEQAQALLGAETFKEDYLLHYMLDFESKGSLLDLKAFDNPFDYQLKIASSTVGETAPTKVDLVETFNYLIGLQVRTIRKVDGVVLVEGQTRDNKNVLVIWRNTNELDSEGLNAFFTEHFAERQKDFDTIYVNGDNTLQNIRPQGATRKVHLTEKEFHYRMFEE